MRLLIYTEEGATQGSIATGLRGLGAETVIAPQAELPNVAVAEIPEALAGPALMQKIRGIPGVRDVEPDALGGTF
jgi:hypothetical protein